MTTTKTIELDGIIGWDVLAADVRAGLGEAGGSVDLRINSPGGDVHEGIAIANALRRYRREGGHILASITGVAASMASYIAMWADEVRAEDNAVLMVHNPWSLAMGDHRTMSKAASILESIRGVLASAYAAKTGRGKDAILGEMDEETWLFGGEIVDAGYADRLTPAGDGPENKGAAMALALGAFAGMRAKLRDRESDADQFDKIAALVLHLADPSAPTTEMPMADTHLADGNRSAEPNHVSDPTEAIASAAAEATASERKRVADILRACAAAHMPERAQALIDDGTAADKARELLINALADRGGPEMRQPPPPAQEDSFEAIIAAKQSSGMTRGKAMRAAIFERPDLHRDWLARIN